MRMGKSLFRDEQVVLRQNMYDVMKARNPTIYTWDGTSQLLMTNKKSATNMDDSDSNDSHGSNSNASIGPNDGIEPPQL